MHVSNVGHLGQLFDMQTLFNGLPLPGSTDALYQTQKNGGVYSIHHESRACKSNVVTVTVGRISLKDTCTTPIPLSIGMVHPAHL